MVNKRTRNKSSIRRKRGLRRAYFLTAFVLAVSSLFIYAYSFESKTHYLKCEGNHYYSDQEIYRRAGVSTDTRNWLTPSLWIQLKLHKYPMIDSVQVDKYFDHMTLRIHEKFVVGSFEDSQGNVFLLTSRNENIPIEEKDRKRIAYYPVINELNEQDRERLAKAFEKEKNNIPFSLMEHISQISPYENTYDKHMVKMQMNDGNILFCSMNSLGMLSKYQQILTKLDKESACLFLDGPNNDIVKSDCASFGQSLRKDEQEFEQEENEQDILQEEEYEFADTGITDWEYVDIYNLYYSASHDLYMYAPTRTYYMLDLSTYSFVEVH